MHLFHVTALPPDCVTTSGAPVLIRRTRTRPEGRISCRLLLLLITSVLLASIFHSISKLSDRQTSPRISGR